MPILMNFEFNENTNSLDANMLLAMEWVDEYLSWDPKDFSNITAIPIKSDQLWVPDVQLYSSVTKFDIKISCTNPSCYVKSDGSIVAIPSCDFSARCEADYSNWPLDSQKCQLLYGAWMEHAGEVDYHTRFASVGSVQSNQNTQWQVVSSKHSRNATIHNNVTYPTLVYDYILERHSSFHVVGMLTPIFLLIILNLFLTWLDTDCLERKLLLAISIICHFYFLVFLQWVVPKNGDTVPGILLFYRNSVVVTGILIIHTLIGSALKRLERTPPNMVTLAAGTVIKHKIGELILAGDYMTVEYKKSETSQTKSSELTDNNETWTSFSRILDRVLFLVFFAAYVVSFGMYIPLKYTSRFGEYDLTVLSYEDINHFN
ncbi:neuronal acetylcholine receptor subunit alpha-5-like [Ochlerotatus camptorhynchus]|uniref:neuronal acetylcholine receptor subunit alpha-5-like n=1 Tax=Ochlerotatus camptorhynchus TaxID=644619 RepID=UPI0031D4B839